MRPQMIITIGREFGSGGHEIAERLAHHYGLALYDRELIEAVADDGMISPQLVAENDEKPLSPLFHLPVRESDLPIEQQVALRTFSFLNREACQQKHSFVVVGRCAESFLAGNPSVTSIFIRGNEAEKAARVEEKYQLSHEDALKKMKKKDKERKNYHNFYCKSKWGECGTYDLCINSSLLGIDGTVKAIIAILDERYK